MTGALAITGVGLDAQSLIALQGRLGRAGAGEALTALPGGFATKRRGSGQDWADVRGYVAGDDLRHIDRGTTARTGELHVRTFREERDKVTLLVADFRPVMLWGMRRAFRSVAAAEALALIGWHIVEAGGRVGALVLGAAAPEIVRARGRTRGMLDVIGAMIRGHAQALEMAQAGMPPDPPLDDALAQVRRIAPAGADIIIASGFDVPGAGLSRVLGELGQRHVTLSLRIVDAAAQDLPAGVYPVRLPDGTKRQAVLGKAGIQAEAEPPRNGILRDDVTQEITLDAGAPLAELTRRLARVMGQGAR